MLLANLGVSSGEELLVIINGGGCDDADGVMDSLPQPVSCRTSGFGRLMPPRMLHISWCDEESPMKNADDRRGRKD